VPLGTVCDPGYFHILPPSLEAPAEERLRIAGSCLGRRERLESPIDLAMAINVADAEALEPKNLAVTSMTGN
jgi:hypothetical protein